jgi:phospholipid/cholesterol/gamma-HCH transport system substrate-binding protein
MKRRNEVVVGMFTAVVLAIGIASAIWVGRGGFARGYPLYTRFTWAENLKEGQAVRVAGVAVGIVDHVKLGFGYNDVTLSITDKQFRIPKSSVATVQPVGIFGDVQVVLTPKMPLDPNEPAFAPGDTVPQGKPPTSMSEVLGRVDTIGIAIGRITAALDKELIASGGIRDLRRTFGNIAVVSANLQGVSGDLRLIAQRQDAGFTALLKSWQSQQILDSMMMDSTFKSVRSAAANLSRATVTLDSMSSELRAALKSIEDSVTRGRGSVARLLNDPTAILRIEGILAHMDSLMIDMKRNPGRYINLSIFPKKQ